MTVRTVALASDHAGYELKAQIARQLEGAGYTVLDLGTDGPASVDYPDFAAALAAAVTDGRAQRGVLICGSGIGISIAANRHPGIRAALVHDMTTARLSREHNDANVIALGARVVGPEIAKDCVDIFLKTEFEGGERHSRRIAKMG
ncbi:ribose 5-phosphate isomerase B [Azospirillum sp. YIM B02556]|uniref:Ribose 5-phosphate isomerase B n=1 Tax=Azospirillum endophyticum TaxID=2800326 RepID=A0ABS1FD95_9PROT|nr:ribose 5-phosphate isomerase B [Azospirillum endophyticum]MBK1841380.1 ribose 5-phosphate isomerase B [Azospirillum endophyticum]